MLRPTAQQVSWLADHSTPPFLTHPTPPLPLSSPLQLTGTYLLSVEDVTDPPFLNEHAETCFVKVKVLPKQSN